jgi:hypothetical protein
MNDLSHPSCNAPNWDNPLSTGSWESCAEAGVKRAGAVVVGMREKAAEVVDDKYLMRRQSSCPHYQTTSSSVCNGRERTCRLHSGVFFRL